MKGFKKMKKLTAILTALLLTAAVATSCAKEEPVKENDTQVEADTPAVEEEIEETLPAEDEETDGEEVEDGKFKLNSTLWTLICTLGDSEIPDTATSTPPTPISNKSAGAEYTELTDLTGFSWKKIIAQILIDKLLEE